jgi:hypothetical protein
MLLAMRVRVRASQLVKGRRRFVDWVFGVDTVRGWRCIRSFRDIEECRAFLVALPLGIYRVHHSLTFAQLRRIGAPSISRQYPTRRGEGAARKQRPSLRAVRAVADPASCSHS